MIYRSGSLVREVQNYAQEVYASPIIPGGQQQSGGCVYLSATSYPLGVGILGLDFALGGFSIAGNAFASGSYLLDVGETTIGVYRGGAFVQTLTRDPAHDPAWSLTLQKESVLLFALRSGSRDIVLTNPGSRYKLGGVQESGGSITLTVSSSRVSLALDYLNETGGQVDQTHGELYPGDLLTYVPPDYQPQPTGDGLRTSRMGDSLQARVEAMDTAFVTGGLVRASPMLTGLSYPASTSPLPMGELRYRLDDGGDPLELRFALSATQLGFQVTLMVDGQARNFELTGGDLYVSGQPNGFGLASSYAGAGGSFLALERNEYREVFLYEIGPSAAPHGTARDTLGRWWDSLLGYVIPGGPGTLTDRRFQVRRSAGPYLFLHQCDAHARTAILAGAQDANPDEFVHLMVGGKLRRYVTVGSTAFDPRLNLLLLGD